MKTVAIIALISSLLLAGCVAPGSSVGRIGLRAHREDGQTGMELHAVLTKEYGLGGLDRHFGKPEDYGNRDIEKVALFDDNQFRIEFPRLVYHVDFWMLPPLGALPRRPPPPVFWVRLSDSPSEVYQVGFAKQEFRYRVFDRAYRKEKPTTEAKWTLVDGRYEPEPYSDGSKIWYLTFRLKEQKTEKEK